MLPLKRLSIEYFMSTSRCQNAKREILITHVINDFQCCVRGKRMFSKFTHKMKLFFLRKLQNYRVGRNI